MELWTVLTYSVYFFFPLYLFYRYATRNNNFWKDRGIPYIRPKFLFGHLDIFKFKSVPVHEFDMIHYNKLGPVYGGFEGVKPYLFVGDPELVKELSTKEFPSFPSRRNFTSGDEINDNMVNVLKGEDWKRIRSIITPAFSSGKLRMMSKLIDECAETKVDHLKKLTSRESVDMKKIFGSFSMDVIASTAFATKIDSLSDPNNPFVHHASQVFSKNFSFKNIIMFSVPFLKYFFTNRFIEKHIADFFDSVVKKVRKERENPTGVKRHDFLQQMIDANQLADQDPSNLGAPTKKMNDTEILAQCILFFVGGYETTASALSFAVYHLAFDQECQDKLAKEVKDVLRESDGVLDYDTLKKMTYLEAVVNETLRITPPGARREREAGSNFTFKNLSFTIPKGTIVAFPVYPIHHDPKYFPDPEKFDPTRFLPENKDAINENAYMPFGFGPRSCVATRFALLEVKLCLAKMIDNFEFRPCRDTKRPLKFFTNFGLLIPQDVNLKVKERFSST